VTAVAVALLVAAHVPLTVQMVTERRRSQVRRLRMVRVIWERQ
jgi:hypothetical protein